MSNFRRGPNVSQYIANLNTISPQDSSSNDEMVRNDLNDLNELEPFLTADFLNFEMPGTVANMPSTATAEYNSVAPALDQGQTGLEHSQQSNDFLLGSVHPGAFDFDTEFTNLNNILDDTQAISQPTQQPLHQAHQYLTQQQPFQVTQQPLLMPQSHGMTPMLPQQELADHKRKSSEMMSATYATEEAARVAAEEDKRRRNTAASARFRVKKKQKEAELETKAKEMTDKVILLQGRVDQLETENKWLKSLITERRTNESESVLVGLQGTGNADMRGRDLQSLFAEFLANQTNQTAREEGEDDVAEAESSSAASKRAKSVT